MRHRLLVVPAPGREHVPRVIECFAHRGHVAMAEDGPAAGQEALAFLVELARQIADQGLRGRQSDRFHLSSLGCPARTESRPIPHLAKRSEPMRHLSNSLVIRDAACKPRLRRLAKYRTPDGEALH